MPLVLMLGLIVPLTVAVADATRKQFCEAVPMVFLGLSLILYVLGLFSCLASAVWMLAFLWCASVVWLVFALWRMIKKRRWPAVSVGLVAFVLVAIALWWMLRGSRYEIWDEFSHWGRAAKAVFSQQVLPAVAAGEDLFRDYPPGVALLQALVLWLGRMDFREDVVIFTQALFSAGLLLYPLRRFSWKKAPGALGALVLLVLAPATVFWNYYTGTMVDGLLGVVFAFVLVVHFFGEGKTFELVLQCMGCAMLPLLKSAGLLWAVLAVAIIFVDELPGRRAAVGVGSAPTAMAAKRPPLFGAGRWKAFGLPLLCAALGAGSWNLYIALFNVPRRWSVGAGGGTPGWRLQTVQNYAASVFTEQNYGWPVGFLPFMGFFVVFAGLWFLLRRLTKAEHKKRMDVAFWSLFACGILYVVLLLCNYLFFFSEYEAVRLSSLSRYLNTYAAAMMVFLTAWLACVLPDQNPGRQGVALAAGAAVWTLLSNPPAVLGPLVTAPQHAVFSAAAQQPYTDAAGDIAHYTDEEMAMVYVVAQDDLGMANLRLGYELAPQMLPEHTSSIGPAYAEDDILSRRITRQQWADLLKEEGYQFVYLFKTDEAFLAEFGPLFENGEEIVDGEIYRVLPRENGVVLELASKSLGDYCYTGDCI
ncbi:hypothetical protein LJB76_00495 [Clostridia bacterium OttesenSCG-928-O13]|nr:hypothetical protein [Clostridia bacterium OttesenSCG-928-O13]